MEPIQPSFDMELLKKSVDTEWSKHFADKEWREYSAYMGWLEHLAGMEPSEKTMIVPILDRYQNCKELSGGGRFAENGKLVDQHHTHHWCFEACIHRASLSWKHWEA